MVTLRGLSKGFSTWECFRVLWLGRIRSCNTLSCVTDDFMIQPWKFCEVLRWIYSFQLISTTYDITLKFYRFFLRFLLNSFILPNILTWTRHVLYFFKRFCENHVFNYKLINYFDKNLKQLIYFVPKNNSQINISVASKILSTLFLCLHNLKTSARLHKLSLRVRRNCISSIIEKKSVQKAFDTKINVCLLCCGLDSILIIYQKLKVLFFRFSGSINLKNQLFVPADIWIFIMCA